MEHWLVKYFGGACVKIFLIPTLIHCHLGVAGSDKGQGGTKHKQMLNIEYLWTEQNFNYSPLCPKTILRLTSGHCMRQSQAKNSQQKHSGIQWASYWHMNWAGSSWRWFIIKSFSCSARNTSPAELPPRWSCYLSVHSENTQPDLDPICGDSRWFSASGNWLDLVEISDWACTWLMVRSQSMLQSQSQGLPPSRNSGSRSVKWNAVNCWTHYVFRQQPWLELIWFIVFGKF